MAVGESSGPEHPIPTRRSGYRYFFYDKHHGKGSADSARWHPDLSQDEEFAVFDDADFHDVSDERGWLYGLGRDGEGNVRDLGTWGQQVAEFPFARPPEPWHGYPLWPLSEAGPQNRKGEVSRPPKGVFVKMEAEGLVSPSERKRLIKGRHL